MDSAKQPQNVKAVKNGKSFIGKELNKIYLSFILSVGHLFSFIYIRKPVQLTWYEFSTFNKCKYNIICTLQI